MEQDQYQQVANEMLAFQHAKLHLFDLADEYQNKTTLSSADDSNITAYHPDAVAQELKDYMNYTSQLEERFKEIENQDRFIRMMTQDPPAEVTEEMLRSSEDNEQKLVDKVQRNIQLLAQKQKVFQQKCERIQELHTHLQLETERMTQIVDDNRATQRELSRIEKGLKLHMTYEEQIAERDRLVEELVQENMIIDEKRENVSRIKKMVRERAKEVQDRESRLKSLQQTASREEERYAGPDPAVEEATEWYRRVTKDTNALFGIQDINETPTTIKVSFDNEAHDELCIRFDPVTDELIDVETTGCDVQDILPLVSSLHDRYEISTVLIRYTLEKLYS
ncbi:hypothetical protein LRAMOSA06427 [Lichtheimia ramosa]|uniref:Kinetochore protein SPC25 n=1 Tax=Lichtheimia ramosa TaxID=688394 RepID=A0A077X520_9FUNG|nr:hypothetical protein LRAMOSA06427 [Lichtheimia ramosa]